MPTLTWFMTYMRTIDSTAHCWNKAFSGMYCQPFLTSYLTWPFGKTLNWFFWLGLASEELQYSLMWNPLLFLCKNDRNIFDMSAFKKDIIEKIHKHSMDNCSCIIRKINPIICLLLEVQGLLYQTLILQFSKWNIPILFYEPGNCTQNGAERIKTTEDGWPPNEAGEDNQRTSSTLATIL